MIAVVGAGAAGLAAARALHAAGREVRVFEAGAAPGGRITSRRIGGFCMDRGFQVLLTSYRSVWNLLPLSSLEPRFFNSGALIWDRGRLWTVKYPLFHPLGAAGALAGGAFSAGDKLRIARWAAAAVLETSPGPREKRAERTALEELQQAGVSPAAVERFFRPFFGGVLLDNALEGSAALMRFYARRFAFGRAFVPAAGMGAFPARLAECLPKPALLTECPVETLEIQGGRVRAVVAGGRREEVEGVIVAVDYAAASRLLNLPPPPPAPPVWTLFFCARESLYDSPLLVLPAGRRRVVRHFVQMTNVAPEYAPAGAHLVVATVLEPGGLGGAGLAGAAEQEIREVFPHARLELLDILQVPVAPRNQQPGFTKNRPRIPVLTNLQAAGDYLMWGSTEGAVRSGLLAARNLLNTPAP